MPPREGALLGMWPTEKYCKAYDSGRWVKKGQLCTYSQRFLNKWMKETEGELANPTAKWRRWFRDFSVDCGHEVSK